MFVTSILFISVLHGKFISMIPSEYDDSFVLLNTNHDNAPLTLFDYVNRDTILPLRMTALTYELLPFQLFKLRYDHNKNIFFTPKIDTTYASLRTSKFMVASKNNIKPNLTLHSPPGGSRTNVFRIKSGLKCLTVGNSAAYDSVNYWKLEFNECDVDDKNQEFIFIPHIIALSYLQRESDFKLDKRVIKQVYNNLDKTLRFTVQNERNEH